MKPFPQMSQKKTMKPMNTLKYTSRSLLGDDLTFVYLALTEDNLVQRIEMRHPGREDIQEIIKVCKGQRNMYQSKLILFNR